MAQGEVAHQTSPPRHELKLPAGGGTIWFRRIPAGEFIMGSRYGDEDEGEEWIAARQPEHRVVIASPFWMAEMPVTQVQFAAWTTDRAYTAWREAREQGESHRNHFGWRPAHPAERMTWYEAKGYCEWLSRIASVALPAGHSAALPSEAQWEYACRGRQAEAADLWRRMEYHSGAGEARLSEVGWFSSNSQGGTRPVGQKRANDRGLYDMHGNVWEWCEDVWDWNAYRKRESGWAAEAWSLEYAGSDDTGFDTANKSGQEPDRVVRGGSWSNTAGWCRAEFRAGSSVVNRSRSLGFRVCLVRGLADPPQPGGQPWPMRIQG